MPKKPVVPVTNFTIGRPIWDQQHNEPGKYYSLFQLFRDLGPERTQSAVAREAGKDRNHINDIAKRWRWEERATAWDAHLVELRNKEIEDAAKSMGRRQAKLGMMLQDRAVDALALVDLSEPSVKDVVQLAEAGVKIERLARGEKVEEDRTVILQLPSLPSWAQSSKYVVASESDNTQTKEPSSDGIDSKV